MTSIKEEEFEKLWKVKVLKDLLKQKDFLDDIVSRSQKNCIERDLKMIYYGYQEGLKVKDKK